MRKLTPKQQRFVDEYLIDFNASAAARRAGYGEKNACKIGPELLGKDVVSEAVRAGQAKLQRKTLISAERVLAETARLAFADPAALFDAAGKLLHVPDMPQSVRRAISSVKVKRIPGGEDRPPEETVEVRFWSKNDALEKLGKRLGIF